MNLDFLQEYCVPVIVGVCLCLGFVVKKWLADVDNRYIPTINAVAGVAMSLWIAGWVFSPEILLKGLFSGLASTGFYEAFRNLLEGRIQK